MLRMIRWSSAAACMALLAMSPSARGESAGPAVQRVSDGVIVTPRSGPARRVRLEVYSPEIVRVSAVSDASFDLPQSLMVVATPKGSPFTLSQAHDAVILRTGKVAAEVSLADGAVRFLDREGRPLLTERKRTIAPRIVEDQNGQHAFETVAEVFDAPAGDAFFGLGQHQQAVMNYRGKDVELAQHNMDVGIPVVMSSAGWGVLWDNNSITRFGDPRPYGMLADRLIVRDAKGAFGGLTASYYVDGKLKAQRQENEINYEYIKDQLRWPEGLKAKPKQPTDLGDVAPAGQAGVKVVWEGTIEAPTGGEHKFKLYSSSYAKVWIDGQLKIDRWRQNWNPWYHDFTAALPAHKQIPIRVEWTPQDGYISLRHLDPLPPKDQNALSLWSDVAKGIDYYFIQGGDVGGALANYRALTGKSTMLPVWAYGFWQSRQRYDTQAQLLGVAEQYRRLKLPIDNIVQDWFYWPENAWGSHAFDTARYPDPTAMVQALHRQNLHVTISVWPKFYPTTEHYKELDAIGGIYRRNVEVGAQDWVGPGYRNAFYDAYNPAARDLYWKQIESTLYPMGFDGWWLDSVEPDFHSNLDIPERTLRMGPTALGPAAQYFNSYPLMNAEGVYRHTRADQPDKRTYILTRSAWGGLQRAGATVWSGDLAARWDDLHAQISAGVNIGLSGIANWTHDIGGFAVEPRYSAAHMKPDDKSEWDELNLRWFQFGAWSPLFRSHGEFPLREVYNLADPGTPLYDTYASQLRLRYRLMPYIYTLAADVYRKDGVMMRGLVFDFPQDRRAIESNDEYLFGPSFLVAPVTAYKARARSVWLPQGADWYDFYTGRKLTGGQEISAAAPVERIPLFVRAGAIVPTGADIQHTGQRFEGPLTITVYEGADGAFDLYEDDGVSYGYERGAFSVIPLRWSQASRTLTIGARKGSFEGMPKSREIRIRLVSGPEAKAADFDAGFRSFSYSGEAIQIRP